MKNLFLLLLAATATAATLPLYIDTSTNTVVSPDAPTTVAGYGITDAVSGTPADGNFLVGNGVAWITESAGDTLEESLGIQTAGGGARVGFLATTNRGGALGNGANSDRGGAVGEGATATGGGAVGDGANSAGGGGAIGSSATVTDGGGAIGLSAQATRGGAVGRGSITTTGGAIGYNSSAVTGGAIGDNAIAGAADAVQLGTGTNNTIGTIQFLSSGSVTAAEFGTLAGNVVTVADVVVPYSTAITDAVLLVSNDAGTTITLPVASSVPSNYRLSIINVGELGTVTVDGDGATINGQSSITITIQYESVTLVTDGANWFII